MRVNHTISIILFLLMLLITSCRQEVDIDYPDFEPMPVINSFIVAGEPVTAHISIAVGYEGPQLSGCDDATVSLYIDDEFSGNMILQSDGLYTSDSIARGDAKYTLSVEVPGYKTASASTVIPSPSSLLEFTFNEFEGLDEEGFDYSSVVFTFQNEPFETRYYDSRVILMTSEGEFIRDPYIITDSVLINEGLPLNLFSNEIIKGIPEYTMKTNYYVSHHKFIFQFRSVSEEYYHYVRQHYLYETGRFPEFGISSNAAYPLYSNVDNGYGIVAGYSYFATDTIRPNN